MSRSAAIAFAGVSYRIGGRTVLENLDLSVASGRVTAVMGPSGTGKTTLLRLLTGQIQPTEGRVIVDGQNLASLDRKGLYALRRNMGMLFQNGALLTDLSVYENVAFPLREHTDLPEAIIRRIVLMKLQSVGLRGAAELMAAELSGGMARRVALARAIVMDPQILIYDEPFAGLDPIALGMVLKLIRELNQTLGITSIVVSHDVHVIEQLADEAVLLSGGGIAAIGSPAELARNPDPAVRQFMSGSAEGPVQFHYPAADLTADLLRSAP
jgi:phospholipid/cholesterol/gamma-HCH transport system ATP-binding protein